MHRKDYEAIANTIARAGWQELPHRRSLFIDIAEGLADHFEHDNPRFDRDRFLDVALPWTVKA